MDKKEFDQDVEDLDDLISVNRLHGEELPSPVPLAWCPLCNNMPVNGQGYQCTVCHKVVCTNCINLFDGGAICDMCAKQHGLPEGARKPNEPAEDDFEYYGGDDYFHDPDVYMR